MADQTQKQTHGALGDVKSALQGIKGAGDTIRGTFNESVDTAFHEREGEAKNKAIKEKGVAAMEQTDAHFNKHKGVGSTTATTHPSSGTTTRVTGGLARNTQLPDGTSTGAGAHSGSVGNMESHMPQNGLGGEPAGSTGRF
ncbi:uncharacterized protein A1O9_05945 [Exophiala aquamarina CBS 119918]|uniref:Uncharacterized protein n=1 Tax=Exophiala aquamarina CBS 119918 TaxID=1182545 RepID=A0A072PE14_9EURO|nr:uncharacterized protein A1O9_05945 [Exophiala aquamarina CBS 119918]KEF58022.1 hypothetical protein A1O9_05945 [Exophiala aquamarina CBS 119918]